MSELYQIKVNSIDGKETTLDFLRGKVALVVNVASRCGFTPQYQGLEELYRKYGEKGLVILGFPCNQLAGRNPAVTAKSPRSALSNTRSAFRCLPSSMSMAKMHILCLCI